LLWELDRAAAAPASELRATCDEIATSIGLRKSPGVRRAPKVKSEPLEFSLAGGATAHVGKSPKDNERVTFVVGGPGDLWFHARGVPGAHVILKLADPRAVPSHEQILAAASLAAGRSRSADAAKVEVDYTQRKHVRKQGRGRVGLVWYTDFKTVLTAPRKDV
jgi:predicted ribosome quality control (RQC) complex YloA/Tae2 family protein